MTAKPGRLKSLLTDVAKEHEFQLRKQKETHDMEVQKLRLHIDALVAARTSVADGSQFRSDMAVASERLGHDLSDDNLSVPVERSSPLVEDARNGASASVPCYDINYDDELSADGSRSGLSGSHGDLPANKKPGQEPEAVPHERDADTEVEGITHSASATTLLEFGKKASRARLNGSGVSRFTAVDRKYELLTAWTEEKDVSDELPIRIQHLPTNDIVSQDWGVMGPCKCELPRTRKGCVVSPNSIYRLCWDVSGMLLIGHDCIVIPFGLAFQPETQELAPGMDLAILIFWTLDMIQAFNLGFYQNGLYVDSHRRILFQYMRGWFWCDLAVVMPEWWALLVSDNQDLGGLGRMIKGTRAIRVLRLLRLLKLQRLIEKFYDMLESEYTFIVMSLVRKLLGITILNHIVACCWYWIGRAGIDYFGPDNWITKAHLDQDDRTLVYKYSTALHWSLTQFTPASMDVSARNEAERIFSIVVLLFAMVAFSSIVGSITSAMTTLDHLSSDRSKQFWLLRRYLRQMRITSDLSGRVLKFLEFQTERLGRLVLEQDIKLWGSLSEELSRELALQIYSSYLVQHPFFHFIEFSMPTIMSRLCSNALTPQTFGEHELIFGVGDEAKCAYFIKHGACSYLLGSGEVLDPAPACKEWASEAILWTSWRHQGALSALSPTEVLRLCPAKFMDVMSLHPRPWSVCQKYGKEFVKFLNRFNEKHGCLSDILRSDLFYVKVTGDLRRKPTRGARLLRLASYDGI